MVVVGTSYRGSDAHRGAGVEDERRGGGRDEIEPRRTPEESEADDVDEDDVERTEETGDE